MKKILFEEQVEKTLKLMGVLTEATSPIGKAILRGLFGGLSNLDNVYDKIALKVGNSFRTRSLSGVEAAISSGKITRKEVIEFLIDDLNKSTDEIIDLITSGSPNILTNVRTSAGTKQTKDEIIAAIPGLNELPGDVVDALLKKAGVSIGDKLTIRELLNGLIGNYPELARKNWFSEFKNNETLTAVIKSMEQKFTGKNLAVFESEIKNMLSEANAGLEEALKKKKLSDADGTTIKGALTKAAGSIYKTINPIRRDGLENVMWGSTSKNFLLETAAFVLLYQIIYCLRKSEILTISGTAKCLITREVGGFKQDYRGALAGTDSEAGVREYIKSLDTRYTQEMVDGLKIKKLESGKYEVTLPNGSKKIFVYGNGTYTMQ